MIMPDPMYGDKKRAFIVRTVYDYTHYRITDQYYLQNLISITSGGKNGTYDQYARIHEDRIIRFDGVKLTSRMMVEQYEGWGMSKLPTIIKDYKRYDTCLTAVAQIVQTSSTMIHKIKGLTETLASKDEEAVLQLAQSLRDVKMLMNVWGGAVVDMENADLNYLSRQFNGLDSIVDKLRESFTAASGISHDQLFGQTPNGWGDSGESEEKKWQKEIEMFQTSEWLSKLKKLYTYVFAAKDCQAQVKDGWEIEFFPLRQVTEKEEIEMRSSQAIIDSTYQAMGAVSIQEIRDSRLRPAKFSAQTILDDAAYKKEQKAAAQQALPPEREALPPEDDLGYDSTFDG
jgi:phage-related protein (TIGR01555 family)